MALVAISEARVYVHTTTGVVFIAEASLAHLGSVQPVCVFDSQGLCQISQDCAREIVQSLVNAVGQVVENAIETWYSIDDASQPSERVVARAIGTAGLVRRCDLDEILSNLGGVKLSRASMSVLSAPLTVRSCPLAVLPAHSPQSNNYY